MRKVTTMTAAAFRCGQNKTVGNTSVRDGEYFLHGNKIAEYAGPCTIKLMDAGWQTVTTKERLNGILEGFGSGIRIFQRNHTWYYSVPGSTPELWTGELMVSIAHRGAAA